jgi:hypothetical protein
MGWLSGWADAAVPAVVFVVAWAARRAGWISQGAFAGAVVTALVALAAVAAFRLPEVVVNDVMLWLHMTAAFALAAVLVGIVVTAANTAAFNGRRPVRNLVPWMWLAFAVVFVTGVWNTLFLNPYPRPPLSPEAVLQQSLAATWRALAHTLGTPYGSALVGKHAFAVGLGVGLLVLTTTPSWSEARITAAVSLAVFGIILFFTALLAFNVRRPV